MVRFSSIRLIVFVIMIASCLSIYGQAPDWNVNPSDFQNSMVAVITISDECMPSADVEDIVAAFDLSGQIRGVQAADNANRAFLTIYSNGVGEDIFFKIYDHSTDAVYQIYDTQVTFVSDGEIGTPPNPPMILNFDSDPQGVTAGPDQEISNMATTTLAAAGIGAWQVIEGLGGSFNDPTDPMSTFTGVIGTIYRLAWTLSDAGGCIGETDEVRIALVLDQPEDNPLTCGDGLDNDGDGLTDCMDSDCAAPAVTSTDITLPTPLSCTTTDLDGQIIAIGNNTDLYSIDMGATPQSHGTFSNLMAGTYDVWMQNSTTGCTIIETVILDNTFDPIPPATDIDLVGPTVVCAGLEDVYYSLEATYAGSVAWAYTGTDVSVNGMGNQGSVDFGDNLTPGALTVTMSSTCHSETSSLNIVLAGPAFCERFARCLDELEIAQALLDLPNAAHVFRAGTTLSSSNTILSDYHYEFSGGTSVTLGEGFTVNEGVQLIADIKVCEE